jgi:hypothetical protein
MPDTKRSAGERSVRGLLRMRPRENAYAEALVRCSSVGAAWYVVPANRRVYRNQAVTSF